MSATPTCLADFRLALNPVCSLSVARTAFTCSSYLERSNLGEGGPIEILLEGCYRVGAHIPIFAAWDFEICSLMQVQK